MIYGINVVVSFQTHHIVSLVRKSAKSIFKNFIGDINKVVKFMVLNVF